MMMFVVVALAVAAPPEPPAVKLLAVGGGATHDAITRKALELGGGPARCRMLIVPQASELPDSGERSAKFWREAGAGEVSVLDLADVAKARAAVESATLIWMPGGDQNRLMKAFEGTGLPEAIRARMRAGAAVGGTSAGAAVLSGVMLTGDAELNAIKAQTTKTAAGLDLWPGVIVDQHFVRRQRFQRLLSAVLDRPTLVGVGIDESTGVAVVGSRCEVVGLGQVVVVDARGARLNAPAAGQPWSAVGVKIAVYTSGQEFDLTPTGLDKK
jgi:cyanophycinase